MRFPIEAAKRYAESWNVGLPSKPGILLLDDQAEMTVRLIPRYIEIKDYPESLRAE